MSRILGIRATTSVAVLVPGSSPGQALRDAPRKRFIVNRMEQGAPQDEDGENTGHPSLDQDEARAGSGLFQPLADQINQRQDDPDPDQA